MASVSEARISFSAEPTKQTEFSLADTKARLSELIARVERGETIDITRRGKHVARLVPVEQPRVRKPIDFEALRRLRESMPFQEVSSVDLLRELRDEGF